MRGLKPPRCDLPAPKTVRRLPILQTARGPQVHSFWVRIAVASVRWTVARGASAGARVSAIHTLKATGTLMMDQRWRLVDAAAIEFRKLLTDPD